MTQHMDNFLHSAPKAVMGIATLKSLLPRNKRSIQCALLNEPVFLPHAA